MHLELRCISIHLIAIDSGSTLSMQHKATSLCFMPQFYDFDCVFCYTIISILYAAI